MKFPAFVFSLLTGAVLCFPLGAQEPSPVEKLQAQFEEAKNRALSPIENEKFRAEATYAEVLNRLEKEYMAQGELNALLEVRKERELFAESKTTGGGNLDALESHRDTYRRSLEPLEAKHAETLANLMVVYRTTLEGIQADQTKAGNIEEAVKAKKILDGLAKIENNVAEKETAAQPMVPSKAPWSAPAPAGEEILNGGTYLDPVTLPVGRHRLRDKITIGGREPARPNQVYLLEGTSISCTDKGEIFVMAGEGNAYGVIFEGAYLTGGLGADWTFVNCHVERTRMAKGDGWRGRPQAARWHFENSLVSGDFFESWNTREIGYQATRTTFDRVKFPDLIYEDEAGALAQGETLVMKNCLFRDCDLPLSVLISTVDCAFVDCSFRDDSRPIKINKPIKATLYATESSNRMRKVPNQVTIDIKPIEELAAEYGAVEGQLPQP